jgi:glycolate oxidase FAD binding subunit
MQDAALLHLIDTVRAAARHGTPLRIRGGGTKDFLGQPPAGELLDLRPLAGIPAYEPSELVVTVRAGTPLAELEATLAAQGQCLPFEPPRFGGGGTVGGMVAAGLSGPARASVGAVRDYVLGVTLVNGRGELLTFGGQVMKNVAGYDVSRLMVGAMGTLGVLVEISLKVLPVAPAETTLVYELGQAEALARLAAWGGQPLPLNASCWVDEPAGRGTLYVRLRGAVAAVEAAARVMGGERHDTASVAADWDACRDQRLPWFADRDPSLCLWRLSVPQTAPVLPLPQGVAPPLVTWHGAERWVQAAAVHDRALRQAAAAAGGTALLFRANNDLSTLDKPRFEAPQAPLDRVHRRLKAEFDPAGILNPGRLFADL